MIVAVYPCEGPARKTPKAIEVWGQAFYTLKMRAVGVWLLLGALGWAGPKVRVSQDTHDFGELVEGELFYQGVVLRNVGDAELILGPLDPSCFCTYAPLFRDRLDPGEAISIRVCFDFTGHGGQWVRESLSICTNDPNRPWVKLVLTGYVRPRKPREASALEVLSGLYLLLDVREREEYERGHLLGAVNLPLGELPHFWNFLPRGLPLIVYGGKRGSPRFL